MSDKSEFKARFAKTLQDAEDARTLAARLAEAQREQLERDIAMASRPVAIVAELITERLQEAVSLSGWKADFPPSNDDSETAKTIKCFLYFQNGTSKITFDFQRLLNTPQLVVRCVCTGTSNTELIGTRKERTFDIKTEKVKVGKVPFDSDAVEGFIEDSIVIALKAIAADAL